MAKDKLIGAGPGPLTVLVAPQMGENIGASARAMLNFGLTGLRLVAPRDGWPNPKAGAMAAGASEVVDGARVFERTQDAIADCAFVLATTARKREMLVPVYEPAEAVAELRTRIGQGEKCAVLFGGERSGLSTDDVALADGILTIPVNPGFSSLNLAQAVLVLAYEWGKASDAALGFEGELETAPPAPKVELERLFEHLEAELEEAGYFHPPEKREVMARTIRIALARGGLAQPEVQTLRGVVKALARGRGERWRALQSGKAGAEGNSD